MSDALLPLEPGRQRLLRLDSAVILKRFLYLERAVIVAAAAWIPAVQRLETKALLSRSAWEDAETARALRNRIFELRYPDRTLELGPERPLVALFDAALDAPGPRDLLAALARVLLPAQRTAYENYLEVSDDIADGPTRRFLESAVTEKTARERALQEAAEHEPGAPSEWVTSLRDRLDEVSGLSLEPPSGVEAHSGITGRRPFRLAQEPARDPRYLVTPFYWPDALDPGYPYGEGMLLQLRSAVSHINEVWAVETAGAILHAFERELGWEFLFDAARWLYDESRHMTMGARRLSFWGFEPALIPLGSYIYQACRDQDPIVRLAMLAFFETKNIGKKKARAAAFGGLGDRISQRDMDFDWADEAIHAGYGRRWLRAALEVRGEDPESWPELVSRCENLVSERVSQATEAERRDCMEGAAALVARAKERGRSSSP
ncbi:MAG TPA: DUF455 family protein [Actinomycetota bacterium]|nr:DUF455 family protein [Actinomycetota bacterium]